MRKTSNDGAPKWAKEGYVNRVYPEINRVYPEVNRAYQEVNRAYQEVDRAYPEVNRVYPEDNRANPEVNRVYPYSRISCSSFKREKQSVFKQMIWQKWCLSWEWDDISDLADRTRTDRKDKTEQLILKHLMNSTVYHEQTHYTNSL